MRKLRVVELYAGTGRSLEPFRRWKRCNIALLVDKNRLAQRTYHHNFPGAPYAVADLSRISGNRIEQLAGGRIDVLLGCPPCQGFSDVGKKDPDDPRNEHINHFSRIAAALRPRAIAMENVPLAALSDEFGDFLRRFEELGYRWTAGILNAALHGSAQCRQRLIYVAIRGDVRAQPRLPSPSHGGTRKYYSYWSGKMESLTSDRTRMLGEAPCSRRSQNTLPHQEGPLGAKPVPFICEALDDLPEFDTPAAERLNHFAWAHTPKLLKRMKDIPPGGRWKGGHDHYSHSYGRLHYQSLARTITSFFQNAGSGRFWHPTENRALTLREAARLQGFPDSFQFLPFYFHAAALVGNALDSRLAEATYQAIREAID